MGAGTLRRWWRRLRARSTPAGPAPARPEHRPGRTHLVLDDGTVVEAGLGPEDQVRVEYLARRAAAPPPPE